MNTCIVTAYLVDSLGIIEGRKSYQKLLYLAKALGIPIDGSYVMYYYGPHSKEVDHKLEYMLFRGILKEQNSTKYFVPGDKTKSIIEENHEFINKYKDTLDRVIHNFGKLEPLQLELITTTHFLYSNLKHLYNKTDKHSILNEVRKTKSPKFNEEQIEAAYNILVTKDLIV